MFSFILKGPGSLVSNFKFQILNFKFQILNFKFQISNFKFQIPNSKFQIPSSKFQIPNFKFRHFKYIISLASSPVFFSRTRTLFHPRAPFLCARTFFARALSLHAHAFSPACSCVISPWRLHATALLRLARAPACSNGIVAASSAVSGAMADADFRGLFDDAATARPSLYPARPPRPPVA
jgi:hypothetical protein